MRNYGVYTPLSTVVPVRERVRVAAVFGVAISCEQVCVDNMCTVYVGRAVYADDAGGIQRTPTMCGHRTAEQANDRVKEVFTHML